MVKYSSIKNDYNNVPWYSNLHDWILIVIKLIALIFIIWNIIYYSFIIIYDNNDEPIYQIDVVKYLVYYICKIIIKYNYLVKIIL
jgi:hypothetical protein